jgi:hypothetical protein
MIRSNLREILASVTGVRRRWGRRIVPGDNFNVRGRNKAFPSSGVFDFDPAGAVVLFENSDGVTLCQKVNFWY